ncbi:ninja-family protein AFP3 [Elaeis guineensis]|uniref:Ninja-family protein n=1 Tax=Elaeis guineensis var. tenera TaxID=51953 RepID=A0A6I9S807_ELAGV|nr:ninja-family protein Os07g0602900 [Elaeis guineensis]
MKEETTEGEIQRICSRNESYSRDFLKRFSGNILAEEQPEATGGDSDEIELSLGLSLGGCFGADHKGKKLVRSSSIASFSSSPREPEFPVITALSRTSSLPTETEEERRKRKELQSLKRMEAKRKRLEKRNSLKQGRRVDEEGEKRRSLAAPVVMKVGKFEGALNGCHGFSGGGHFGGLMNGAAPPGTPGWAPGSGRVVSRQMSQGSIGSQGSSSSGMSEYDSRPMQGFDISGFSSCTEARSSLTIRSLPENSNHKMAATPPTAIVGKAVGSVGGGEEDPPKKIARRASGMKEVERNMMEEMPCVSTRGEGPNGRRIEGFLYKYKKGEEVRIVCVCHGSFLTPAEFVRHAGGGDVAHPLRHIVVNPSPPAFL